MRRLKAAFVAGLTVAFFIVSEQPAVASGCPDGTTPSPGDGLICIPVQDPGTPPGDDDNTNVGNGPRVCKQGGNVIPCEWAGGVWNHEHGCYLIPTVQPPADSDLWQGNDPSQGTLYACDLPGQGTPSYVFVPGANPDPAALARSALDQLTLTVPNIKTAPATTGMTYVGLRTWLWIPESQWGTLRRTVTVGGTSVTVTAEPRKVAWNLGPATTTCNGPGRAWVTGHMSSSDATNCGYTYTQVSDFEPDKKFRASATITFRANWTCAGACTQGEGSLGEVDGLPGATAIRVGERQSVNTSLRND